MDNVHVSIKILSRDAQIPHMAYNGDAGVDLRSVERIVLEPQERAMVATGLAIALPEGYAGFVLPRSGLAAKHGISIVNAPGLIDSNYRGELKVILLNNDPNDSFAIEIGDRIAQLIVIPIPTINFEQVEELTESQRGESGFGSSGIRN
ncbi:MAG: dUTP diphosphatase [Senegalimassilia sp.]|uniref:dUTP diphosphatase n=1 Tax=Senegalimassilia sp. TaxID=1922200 RepID=UPI0028459B55|nr:dUTP diphosphatase [Senegalimassilia sp.]MDR3885364.1 dUTP diphosphatase [Senegalimassilia sp.]MDR4054271.1 dUTP diphosphatase [Senegalimassilia sp.]